MKVKKNPIDGVCCACGYGNPEETTCDKMPDRVHCNHWWEGPEDECIVEPDPNIEICICGSYPLVYGDFSHTMFKCQICKRKTRYRATVMEAQLAWNKRILKERARAPVKAKP